MAVRAPEGEGRRRREVRGISKTLYDSRPASRISVGKKRRRRRKKERENPDIEKIARTGLHGKQIELKVEIKAFFTSERRKEERVFQWTSDLLPGSSAARREDGRS